MAQEAKTPSPLDQTFVLTDQNGKEVSGADFKARPTVLFFGFTHCPDVCPTSMAGLAGWIKDLGPAADHMNFVFVSVDWIDDKPATLREYVSSFDERIQALSGTKEEIKKATRAFGAFSARIPAGDGTFTFAHSASIYLLDTGGAQTATIEYGEDGASSLNKLKTLAGRAKSASNL